MIKKVVTIIGAALICQYTLAIADNSMANDIGVGARALSFGNNYVAAANDLSSVYWNPGALAFIPVREFQIAFDALTSSSTTEYYGTTQTSSIRRLRLASAGYMSAVPTQRGGLSFAFAVQNPVVFERNPSFNGTVANTRIYRENDYRGYGGLRYWSGSLGIQVAPGLGIGFTPSFVSGRETIKEKWVETTSGIITQNGSDTVKRNYLGYDLRAGILYSLMDDNLRLGGRLDFPQKIWFEEKSAAAGGIFNGMLTSSFRGALGAAYTLPLGTVSSELRFRAPFDFLYPDENIPEESPAHYFKTGAGIGCELPLLKSNSLVRIGYSWDEFDLYQFAMQYENEPVGAVWQGDNLVGGWGTDGVTVNSDRHEITMGFAYVTNSVSFEATYSNQLWNLTTNGHREENEHLQRVLVSMSTRF